MTERYKIAFIGSHGVGKTTLCYGLAARLKARDISLTVVGEIARRSPLPINRSTTEAAQSWILHTQIAEEILATERYDTVICDRSVLDNFVYLLISTGRRPALEILVDDWISTYDLLVHVPIVSGPRADGLRSTDPAFQRLVEQRLLEEIAARKLGERQIEILDLSGLRREEWIDLVEETAWKRLSPQQLELL